MTSSEERMAAARARVTRLLAGVLSGRPAEERAEVAGRAWALLHRSIHP
ncbi:hypothetical protein AB0J42_08745 [Nonomuraea sp. NPDC049649]